MSTVESTARHVDKKETQMKQNDLLEAEVVGTELASEAETSTALATREISPMSLIQVAITQGVDTDKLEKLLDLQERWEANELRKEQRRAEVAFGEAMAACQAAIQVVVASHVNSHTKSKYADLADMDAAIRPVYTKHGFSLSFGTTKSDLTKHVHVFCDVRHSAGHVCRYEDDFPTDDAGINGTPNKTPIQAKGSTTSYAQRYLTKGIFNVVIRGEDNDGNAATEKIDDGQVAALRKELDRILPADRPAILTRLLSFAECETIEQIPQSKFQPTLKKLRASADQYSPQN